MPVEGAALLSGEVDFVATAPAGKLELDGKSITADQPFPDVFHVVVKVANGTHSLALLWEGEKGNPFLRGAQILRPGSPRSIATRQLPMCNALSIMK